ncbi:UTP6 [Sanghuangporus weigelae]
MERVQFQQEQMLAELKDLVQKGLFTQNEIRQVMKKRTVFETALVRRIPKKSDFLRYAAYEMSLEALRRKRVERLKLPKGPPTVSDFALVRRQFQIFERALKKFKDDVSLWVQYIQAAQRAKARALVSRICGRALQLHPNSPALYIIAASHELKHLSHAAARVLLQRGIRLNSENVDLWREYVKMELGFVESLRRRWKVLGLTTDAGEDEDMGDLDKPERAEENDEALEEADKNDEQARKEILNGAIVKTVISSAVKALPTPHLFTSLHEVLSTYPCPSTLRWSLLDHLHSLLHSRIISPQGSDPDFSNPRARLDAKGRAQCAKLYATRYLTLGLEGEALVDALRKANEDLMEFMRARRDDDEMTYAYAQFVTEWFEKEINEHLNLYLLASLQSICSSGRSAPLYVAHLRLLRSSHNPSPFPPAKLLKLARKYVSRCPTDVDLWLLRLDVEYSLEIEEDMEGADWRGAWEEGRRKFISRSMPADSRRDEIWMWGLERLSGRSLPEQISELESLLAGTQMGPSSSLSEKLLIRYIRLLHRRAQLAVQVGEPVPYVKGDQAKDVSRIASKYLPTERMWEAAFDTYSSENQNDVDVSDQSTSPSAVDEQEEREQALRTIYDTWRLISPTAHSSAALKWGSWLIRHGKGGEATRVIANARTVLAINQDAGVQFDQRWKRIVDSIENDQDEGGQEEGIDSDDGLVD